MYNTTSVATKIVVDLRSDTVTKPSAAMRRVMAEADVGDDVYGDDPTVEALEERVADMLGKEAALFVASGTQSNLTAMLSHCARGEEYVSGERYHVARYEAQGAAVLGGIAPCHLSVDARGGLDFQSVKAAIKPDDPHYPVTRAVCLENTVYGRVQDQENIEDIADFAHDNGLVVHLDGARLMNAVVKSNRTAKELTAPADSVSLCLSKGLGAPVGSVLSGSKDFIAKARRHRKMVGGGMRQAGVLAACGLYALEHNVKRLAEDHERAQKLAMILSKFDAIDVKNEALDTNMVFFALAEHHHEPFYAHLESNGIRFGAVGDVIRLVTHLDVDDEALSFVEGVLEGYFG